MGGSGYFTYCFVWFSVLMFIELLLTCMGFIEYFTDCFGVH